MNVVRTAVASLSVLAVLLGSRAAAAELLEDEAAEEAGAARHHDALGGPVESHEARKLRAGRGGVKRPRPRWVAFYGRGDPCAFSHRTWRSPCVYVSAAQRA